MDKALLEKICGQAAAEMRAAIQDAKPDRELVTRAFNTQLAAFKLEPRPVIFYPNLDAARAVAEDATSDAWDAWAVARDALGTRKDAAETVAVFILSFSPEAWTAAFNTAWDAAKDTMGRYAAWKAFLTPMRDTVGDAAWAVARATTPNGEPPPDHPFIVAARSFLGILRGGTFLYFLVPDAVHVVLARIHTQQVPKPFDRLHCEDGPALQYEDGSGLYFWEGIQVPEHIILAPERLSVKKILEERNTEVRRAMVERYGRDRFVRDAKAQRLDQWNGVVPVMDRALLRKIDDQAGAAMRAAIQDAKPDRQLVTHAFHTQLAAFKLKPRPVIFYPNLKAAAARVIELSSGDPSAWEDTWYPAMAPWDAAMEAARKAAGETVLVAVDGKDAVREALGHYFSGEGAAWDVATDAAWEVAMHTARDPAGEVLSTTMRDIVGHATWDAAEENAMAEEDGGERTPWSVAWAVATNAATAAYWAVAWDVSWGAAPNGKPLPEHLIVAARSCLNILRGGTFFYFFAPEAVHVVLARTHFQQAPGRPWMRFHCENAPAIEYEDGSGLYFWKGIRVPKHVIRAPERLRVRKILKERNAAVRRAMIERYGQDRFVLDAKAKRLDQWKGNELLSIDLPEDPDGRLVALKLICPSTSAVYIIRVPPDQTTVRGALAWSFEVEPEDYVLQQES